MRYAAITSMDKNYYNRCGKNFLSSFKKNNWGDIMPLYVYNEDNFDFNDTSFVSMGWNLGKDYNNFQARHKNNRVKTFSKKGFSIIHAMENIDCDILIWLDADTVVKQKIDILDKIISEEHLSAHFSVWHEKEAIKYHSCETGFFMLNKNHKGFKNFMKTYKDIYVNDKIEGMRRFYDGEVYGKTIQLMIEKGHSVNNLNPAAHKTPMSRSILKEYIVHNKAGLKDRVYSDQ